VLLLASLIFTAACSSPSEKNTEDTSDSTTETTSETTTAAITVPRGPSLPDTKYDGKAFRVLVRTFGDTDPWLTNEVMVEELNGEIINDSIFERTAAVEARFNIEILPLNESNVQTFAQNNILANDDAFEAVMSDIFTCTNLAQGGLVMDINKINYIDLGNEWWDQSSVRDFSIGDKQLFVTGDFSYRNYNASWIYAFNKTMIDDFGLDNPYDLVTGGKWTIDKFAEMMTDVSKDVNGDGTMDDNDSWGLITETSNTFGMFIGAENFVVAKDADNYPVITINTERGVQTLEKVFRFMNDKTLTTSSSDPFYSSYPDVWAGLVSVFTDSRGLFYSIVMYTVKKLRGMEADFGLVPMPKFNEQQAEYYTWTSPWIASGLVIPQTVADADYVGMVLEELAYQSMITVRPAYYEVTLESKYARDEQSAAMVDIILGNRVYDLAMVYNWGGVGNLINNMTNARQDNFASQYESIAEAAKTAIDKTNEEFRALA
jgi:hypothetical protein